HISAIGNPTHLWTANAEDLAGPLAEEAEEVPEARRGDDRDHDHAETGRGEQDQRPEADLSADEARDPLRVDQDLPHLQARDERRRHARAVSFEELAQVEVRPDGDDQPGAPLGGAQPPNVLA